ncbi:hypothetical protein CTI12_AA242460 [Artemisia annua]|uniref:Uncharacterized protein n=1 Tax=Artemisia annua TaxID=35608 RepID=A0A2U1NK86_ARTAN|nr:hypothetical protein CTI12_AA242460 [Artemisia annua]
MELHYKYCFEIASAFIVYITTTLFTRLQTNNDEVDGCSIEDVVLRIDMRDGRYACLRMAHGFLNLFRPKCLAWYFYKESSWIKRLLFLYLVFWDGSFVTCGYIAMLFFKLSPEESSTDPIFFVLAKRQKGDVMGHTRRYSVVTAKVIVAALGLYMLGWPTYAYIVDGSPFHAEVVTP